MSFFCFCATNGAGKCGSPVGLELNALTFLIFAMLALPFCWECVPFWGITKEDQFAYLVESSKCGTHPFVGLALSTN
jgi:hypothetical protein